MHFFDAGHLRTKSHDVGAKRIERSGGKIVAVVDGIDAGKGVVRGQNVVDARGTEVLANGLQRAAEDFGDAAGVCRKRRRGRAGAGKIGVTSGGSGPEIQQRLNAGNSGGASREIGSEGGRGLVEALAESFVVGE